MPSAARSVKRPRFSVVAIVRNEASRFPRLIASLAEFRERGGEIVVLDTGSDDGTAEVARGLGCRVHVEPRRFANPLTAVDARRINRAIRRDGERPLVEAGQRMFHFARARTFAAKWASRPYHLAVDGGDVIESMDVDALDALIRDERPSVLPFITRMRNPGGWTVEIRDYFHDSRVMGWSGRSHNHLVPRRGAEYREATLLPRDQLSIRHESDLSKPRTYQLAGTALEYLSRPGDPRWGFLLSRYLASSGWPRSAKPIAEKLDHPKVSPAMRSAALTTLALAEAASGGSDDVVDDVLFRAARRDSSRRDPLLSLAARSLKRGDLQAAVSLAKASLAIPTRIGLAESEDNLSTRPHAILYWSLFWLGRKDEARAHFEICRRHDPSNATIAEHQRLFEAA